MPVREFGFICGDFSVGMSSNGFLLPGSDESYFGRSLVPGGSDANLTGRYLLRVYHCGSVVCKAKVEVAWGKPQSHAEQCLAIKAKDASALSEALGKFGGKQVELRFTPIAKD
jgi:hypothetical protein